MQNIDLQKSAEPQENAAIPKEVLNPHQTAKLYTFHTYQPSSSLTAFVDYYWIMRWDLTDRPPFVAEVIPSPYTNLTFMPEGARITGVTTGKYTYELKGAGAIVGVKFKPGGLHAFWKKSLHKLTDRFVPASQLFTEVDAAYSNTMLSLSDENAIGLIEGLLHAQEPKIDKNLELVTSIMSDLEAIDQISLTSIVEHSGLSERRLQEIFRKYVGVGVKWIILRARLIKAAELAATLENPNWTTIAQELGYADQPHFINDFRRVIGKSPRQYAMTIKQT